MHGTDGLLTFQGWLLLSVIGIGLLALGCVALAYLLVKFSTEDRHAVDREAAAMALSAPRIDDPERRDDARDLGLVSSVQLEIGRDLTRRTASPSLAQRRAEIREGRPFPPAA
jgi:cbb3-type cytochrome oxidase subunit 3